VSSNNIIFTSILKRKAADVSGGGVYTHAHSMENFKPALFFICVGRDSVVSIATHYGLDGPGIESQWEQDFLHLSRPALGSTQLPVQWVPGPLPGLKKARA
jgi:hypothetical protein